MPDERRTPEVGGERVRLVLRNPSGEWIDVRIDGAVVAEFRGSSELIVDIAPGLHRIELVPFIGDEAVYVGRLDTAERDPVVLGIDGEPGSVTAYDGVGLERLQLDGADPTRR